MGFSHVQKDMNPTGSSSFRTVATLFSLGLGIVVGSCSRGGYYLPLATEGARILSQPYGDSNRICKDNTLEIEQGGILVRVQGMWKAE